MLFLKNLQFCVVRVKVKLVDDANVINDISQ